MDTVKSLDLKEWKALVDAGKVVDISHELPNGFLMIGQFMRAKIILDSKVYYATGWNTRGSSYVELKEVATNG